MVSASIPGGLYVGCVNSARTWVQMGPALLRGTVPREGLPQKKESGAKWVSERSLVFATLSASVR